MRTLKKTLALVLCLAMVAGLCCFGTSAAFADAADIENTEAVEVMNAVGVLKGDGTNFNPKGVLTRAEAAVMIAKLVGEGDIKATSTFKDMKGYEWAQSYAAFCEAKGYILGDGAGNFFPGQTLTGYQFGLMLCRALGYKPAEEGVESATYEIGTAALMKKIGMDKAVANFDGTAGLTRENAAALLLAAIKTPMVEYEGGSTVSIGGVVITTGATRKYVVAANGTSRTIGDGTVVYDSTTYDTVELGEVYFTKLGLRDNGNGTHTWTLTPNTIGTYGDTGVIATYTGPVSAAALYSAGIQKAGTVTVYVNGDETGSDYTSSLNIIRGAATTMNFTEYNGATITLLADATGKVAKINVVMPYLAKVIKVFPETATTDAYTQLSVYKTSSTPTTAYIAGDAFAKDDYILYAPSADTLKTSSAAPDLAAVYLAKAESFTSTVTAYNETLNTFVANGATYTYSTAAQVKASSSDVTFDVLYGTTYDMYVDANGTIIGSKVNTEGTSTLNYVYVLGSESSVAGTNLLNAAVDAFKVKVMYLDGTIATLDYAIKTAVAPIADTSIIKGDRYYVAPDGTNTELTNDSSDPIAAGLYSYVITADGKLQLSNTLTSTGVVPTTAATVGAYITVNKGSAAILDRRGGVFAYATANTQLVLSSLAGVTTYTGYNNFPVDTDLATSGDVTVVYVYTGSTTKTISNILVVNGTAAADTTPDNYAVYAGAGDVTNEGAFYKFFVDGETKSYLLSDSTVVAAGDLSQAVYGLTLDAKGKAIITTVTQTSLTVAAATADYIASSSAAYYVDGAFKTYDITAPVSALWVEAEAGLTDVVTIVYAYDATAQVNEIKAVYITTNNDL